MNEKLKFAYQKFQHLAKKIRKLDTKGKDALQRDITGICEEECRDRVKEAQMGRQREINTLNM